MPDTFCVFPFVQLILRAEGHATVCNRIPGRIGAGSESGNSDDALSIHDSSIDAIVNSAELVEMRRRMVNGEPSASCRSCYHAEATGAVSLRQQMLEVWQDGYLNLDRLTVEQLRADAIEHGFVLQHGPASMQLDIGNLCNLKCRMCNSGASSRISHDPVHRAWSGPAHDLAVDPALWFKQRAVVQRVLEHSADLQHLHIIGGEPFLIDEVGDILTTLIDAGVAENVDLSLHTNATRSTASWLHLTEQFRSLVLYVSVDGVESGYEYIRAPARWDRFVANLAALGRLSHAELRAHAVVQAYNALDITGLFRFLDDVSVPFEAHLLDWPTCLQVSTLPESARHLAASRLRTYAASCRTAATREPIEGLANHLDTVAGATAETLREFMLFTNDLDASRGQSFADTFPELAEIIAGAGVRWTTESRHFPAVPVTLRVRHPLRN